ncbi:DUF2199 domain-containing protein [Variovorax sp.]|uniref:DUF2199 domain-containing protein n=1 Tax=Variovorax sp. TaxID=1871043 RepID=UPI0037D9E9DB
MQNPGDEPASGPRTREDVPCAPERRRSFHPLGHGRIVVWVSLSKKSFDRYDETFDDPVEGEGFFGWVCNDIDVYPYPSTRPADVRVQLGNQRPKVILHKRDSEDDPLVIDQTRGISVARAQELAEQVLHRT